MTGFGLLILVCLAAEEHRQSVRDLLASAWSATEQGDFVRGEALAGQALLAAEAMAPEAPAFAEEIERLASHQRRLGFGHRAEMVYRAAIQRAADQPAAKQKLRIMLAFHLAPGGRTLDAISQLEQALEIPGDRYHRQILAQLAAQYEVSGEMEKAESALRQKLAATSAAANEVVETAADAVGVCGGVFEPGLQATSNELADFFERTGRHEQAGKQLRLAVAQLPAGAGLRSRAGVLLGLYRHLFARGDRAGAAEVLTGLGALAAVTPKESDREANLDLRLTLARGAGNPDERKASYAVIREDARHWLGEQSWQYVYVSMELGIPPNPAPPAHVPAPAPLPEPKYVPLPPYSARNVQSGTPAAAYVLANGARSHYPALLRQWVENALFRGERRWMETYRDLLANAGPQGEVEALRAQLRLEDGEAEELALRQREFVLVETFQGPYAQPLQVLSRELASAWDGDWPRALPMWRRHVELRRRFHGASSPAHIGALLEFAEEACRAEEYGLALELADQAAALSRGNRDMTEAAAGMRRKILEWRQLPARSR